MSRLIALLCAGLWVASAALADAPEEASGTPPVGSAPPPRAARPTAAAPEGASEAAAKRRFGVSLDRRQKLEIRSDEFEATRNAGAKHFTFRKNVEVTQADVRIRADQLDAYYPRDAKEPERLVAMGSVVVTQGDREARCERAIYHRGDDNLVCTGSAELRDGMDRVRGDVIEFDLAKETVTVTGGAELELYPRPKDLGKEPEEVRSQ